MNDIKYTTENERQFFVAMQKKLNIDANGVLGMNTLTTLAFQAGADVPLPRTLEMYGYPVIIGNDILAFNPNGAIKNYANSMLGSFTYPRATTPCSILVNNRQVVWNDACRAWAGYPEAVIYRLTDGTFGCGEFKYASELPKNVKWAVGGFGLLDLWNPDGQGFKTINGTDYYNTVAYKTYHNVLGLKNGKVYGIMYRAMTAVQVNEHCKKKMRFDHAIMLDGGGLAAINGTESFAQYHTGLKQGYAIQFI